MKTSEGSPVIAACAEECGMTFGQVYYLVRRRGVSPNTQAVKLFLEQRKQEKVESCRRAKENKRKRNLRYQIVLAGRPEYKVDKKEWGKEYRQRPEYKLNEKSRYQTDPEYRIKKCLRSKFYKALTAKSLKKTTSSLDIIGCSPAFLRQHIEIQFKRWMNWGNYGTQWHIDHIIPVSRFDLTDKKQQLQAFHYTNLQPLAADENLRKHNKILQAQMSLLLHA